MFQLEVCVLICCWSLQPRVYVCVGEGGQDSTCEAVMNHYHFNLTSWPSGQNNGGCSFRQISEFRCCSQGSRGYRHVLQATPVCLSLRPCTWYP